MKSLILSVLVKTLRPILAITALWLLLRGHDAPGGGFIAGLMASFATILQMISGGWRSLRPKHREHLFSILGVGLLLCILSGVIGMGGNASFMTARWLKIGSRVNLGTPLLFDLGIALVVYSTLVICTGLLLSRDEEGEAEPT